MGLWSEVPSLSRSLLSFQEASLEGDMWSMLYYERVSLKEPLRKRLKAFGFE